MRGLRFIADAVVAGAAWLGFGLLLSDENPLARLGVLAALVALAGGRVARAHLPAAARIVVCLALVALVRGAAGPSAAVITAALIALGWWLQVRFRDAALALALFAVAISAIGRPSWGLLLAFLGLGVLTAALARLIRVVSRLCGRTAAASGVPVGGPFISESRGLALLKRLSALARVRRQASPLRSRDPREVIP